MEKRNREKQLRYLAQSIRLREAASPRLVRTTMLVTSLSILMFLGWAAVTDIHEIAHTPGEVVPSGRSQIVQHLEGGIVKEIMARDGETVEEGQVVMKLDGAGAVEDLQRAREKKLSFNMQEERLRAFLENREPKFPPEAAARPDLLRDQEAFFAGMTAAREKESAVVKDQIAQKKQAIATLQADLDTARKNEALASSLYQRHLELNRQGYLPEMRLLESEQNYNQIKGEIKSLNSQIAAAKSAIAEYQSRLSSLNAGNVDTANQKLDGILAAESENDEIIKKLQDRVARLDVRAPVRGIVKGLAINTVGSVVQPGQVLMEIVPTDEQLIVSLRIPPRNIGHLKPGQDVQVKFSSYDFSRYGAVGGRLSFLSATTYDGKDGERYYEGRVNLDRSYVGSDKRNAVVPGMTVMADIVTGEKTILEYLLKPIRNALSTAFTER